MKKVIYASLLVVITLFSCKDNKNASAESSQEVAVIEANTEASFGVRGNCEMCKKTIETAALGIAGVTHANWDVKLKKIDVAFNSEMTDQMAIHHAIASSGYDTDQMTSEDASYQNLPKCCQYDHSMEMSLSTSEAEMDHQMHEGHK